MQVLRRTGVAVHDAGVDEPRARGLIRVGERKYAPSVVISMAQDVLEREARRNAELRKQWGLE